MCGKHSWNIVPAFVPIVTHETSTETVPGVLNMYLPSVAFICTTCGNTQFINLRALGLIEIAEGTDGEPAPQVPADAAAPASASGS